ncbi:hypothetical protein R1flu_017582 [Riccia fluitans]|uniref:CBM20 domain-containing protein n=1 Tax=Riccia fluitans TaxID=41844 RepID=A0ABD1ZDE2_9MARC
MQPLTLALPGVAFSHVEVRCGIGTCTSEATRGSFGNGKTLVCRAGFVRGISNAVVRRTRGGQADVVTLTCKRSSVKLAATSEDGTADVLTLKTEPEPEEVDADPEIRQEPTAAEENVEQKEDSSLKTSVKFVLRKQCHFGQQFNVVGEVPELGEWDPSQAVPMEWSEGHVWTAQVPIPTGLTVEYKFLMTGRRLELVWQSGENRVFETKDESDLTVSGVWDESAPDDIFLTDTAGEVEETGDIEETAGDDSEENAPSTNGEATGSLDSDLEKAVIVATEEVASTEEGSDSVDAVVADTTEQEENPPESPEIPMVEGLLATAVAEAGNENSSSKSEEDDAESSTSPISRIQKDFDWTVKAISTFLKGSNKEDE